MLWTKLIGLPIDPSLTSICEEDVQGLMEVVDRLDGDNKLDLILQTPCGPAEATEVFVSYLRMKFKDIRSFAT
jgi:hypothetical protein